MLERGHSRTEAIVGEEKSAIRVRLGGSRESLVAGRPGRRFGLQFKR